MRFRIAAWDRSYPLVIDPVVLGCATYLAGSSYTYQAALAVDSLGQAYVTGRTGSADYPITDDAYRTDMIGPDDIYVSKLNAAGTQLVYSTYLGGNNAGQIDEALSIAVDASGQAYVAGRTSDGTYPTTLGAYQTSMQGSSDAFVTKLNATGSALVYSTYLGGPDVGSSSWEFAFAIAVDGNGYAYVTGVTNSEGFPTTAGAYQSSLNGREDAFVVKFNQAGTGLVYSTYLGGNGNQDPGLDIAVDAAGQAYVTGYTNSTDFATAGAFQTVYRGANPPVYPIGDTGDAFVVKLNDTGSARIYATYLGGTLNDEGWAIAMDGSGQAYVLGHTRSSDYPVKLPAYQASLNGDSDAFVAKFNAAGSDLVYSTYLGGSADESVGRIAVDTAGRAYAAGGTNSSDFPTAGGPFQAELRGLTDDFLVQIKADGSGLEYSTYLGGSYDEWGGSYVDIALGPAGQVYVAGVTNSLDFPTTAGAFQASPPAGAQTSGSGFLAKFTGFTSSTFAFKTFKVDRLRIDRHHKSFFLDADFTLARASDGLNPKSEPLTLTVGNFTLNIPAGKLRAEKHGRFSFTGKIGKLYVKLVLTPKAYKRYDIEVTVYGADLGNVCNKKTAVELKIGNDTGKTWDKPHCEHEKGDKNH